MRHPMNPVQKHSSLNGEIECTVCDGIRADSKIAPYENRIVELHVRNTRDYLHMRISPILTKATGEVIAISPMEIEKGGETVIKRLLPAETSVEIPFEVLSSNSGTWSKWGTLHLLYTGQSRTVENGDAPEPAQQAAIEEPGQAESTVEVATPLS